VTTKAYNLPESLDEALGMLAQYGSNLLVMAGGTLAMPLITKGVSQPERVMGLRRAGLSYVRETGGSVAIGAATPLTQVVNYKGLPLLPQAAHNIGGWAIRNMGTVGGNLFAPPPAGDLVVALLALDASVKLANARRQRVVPLAGFFSGFMANVLEPDELVVEVQVPRPQGDTALLKLGRLHTDTPTVVGVATRIVWEGRKVKEARVALNGVGPYPMRARKAEAMLVGTALDEAAIAAAAAAAAGECEPFSDPIASEWYRRKMTGVIVSRALAQVAA